MNTNTPKHFVIQLGALLALYASVTALLILLFNVINLKFPDEAAYYYESEGARSAIRGAMAFLVVFFPTYLVLTRLVNQTRRKETQGEYTLLARWLVYLSLLVAGGVLLGDLVTLIMYFLNGEITTRFIWKVVALFVVVGGAFHYYFLDVRGYFTKRIEKSTYFAIGAIVFVATSVLFGYQYIETPSEVREQRFDEQQVMDLQNIQASIESYYQLHNALPSSLADAYGRLPIPEAPTGREPYAFNVTNETHYQLCATFTQPSADVKYSIPLASPEANYNWAHDAGVWCFERVIIDNPKLVPLTPEVVL